jgi:hypothetical protein
MYWYIEEYIPILVFIFILTFLIFRCLTERIRISEFDSLGVLNITVTFSVVLLFSFFLGEYINLQQLIQILTLIFSFYLGIYLVSMYFKPSLKRGRRKEVLELFAYDNLKNINLVMMFVYNSLIGVLFAILLLKKYGGPDERLLVAKSNRAIDIIRIGISSVLPYYAVGLYLLTKKKIYLAFIFLLTVIGFFSGSKGFLLQYIVTYFTLDGLINGKRDIKFYIRRSFLFFIFIASAVLVKIFWGATTQVALMDILNRILASGDIYYLSFIIGDYTQLFGEYNLIYYILHPFTSIIGIRGYEFPIGALILSTAGREVVGTGPNPHLPILSLILAKGVYLFSLFFSFLVGCFVCISRIVAINFIAKRKIPPYWRIAFFSVFFDFVSHLYIDIGYFEFVLIGTFVVTVIFSVFYEFILGLRYKRREPILTMHSDPREFCGGD